jgi:hypothetical protein
MTPLARSCLAARLGPAVADNAARMQAQEDLPDVGPTPAGQPIGLTDKPGRMLSQLEHAHLPMAPLHRTVETPHAQIAQLSGRLDRPEGARDRPQDRRALR